MTVQVVVIVDILNFFLKSQQSTLQILTTTFVTPKNFFWVTKWSKDMQNVSIKGLSNYLVSIVNGEVSVTSIKTGKVLSQFTNKKGYRFFSLKKDSSNVHRNIGVHRLVVAACKDVSIDELECVHHGNGSPSDNAIENLQQCTLSQNASLPKHFSKKRSLPKGIYHFPVGNKPYRVIVKSKNKQSKAKYFKELPEAIAFYKEQMISLYGENVFSGNLSIEMVA